MIVLEKGSDEVRFGILKSFSEPLRIYIFINGLCLEQLIW